MANPLERNTRERKPLKREESPDGSEGKRVIVASADKRHCPFLLLLHPHAVIKAPWNEGDRTWPDLEVVINLHSKSARAWRAVTSACFSGWPESSRFLRSFTWNCQFFKAHTLGNADGTWAATSVCYYIGIICATLILKSVALIWWF